MINWGNSSFLNQTTKIVASVGKMFLYWCMGNIRFSAIQINSSFLVGSELEAVETPVWQVLDFEGNPCSDGELCWQRAKILKAPLVNLDRERVFE